MLEKPDVGRVVNIQSFVGFQVSEKVLPLPTEPFSDIVPDPLDPTVVNTPIEERS